MRLLRCIFFCILIRGMDGFVEVHAIAMKPRLQLFGMCFGLLF